MTIEDGDGLWRLLRSVFNQQKLAVLTTCSAEQKLHSTIVCFVSADNLRSMVFVTPIKTRKYENLLKGGEDVLFVDTRAAGKLKVDEISAVEARGPILILDNPGMYRELYLRRFPDLVTFADAAESAWCRMQVSSYDVVRRFQEVVQLFPEKLE